MYTYVVWSHLLSQARFFTLIHKYSCFSSVILSACDQALPVTPDWLVCRHGHCQVEQSHLICLSGKFPYVSKAFGHSLSLRFSSTCPSFSGMPPHLLQEGCIRQNAKGAFWSGQVYVSKTCRICKFNLAFSGLPIHSLFSLIFLTSLWF